MVLLLCVWCFVWLFVLVYYGLLLVFDGCYCDFLLGLFVLFVVGYVLVVLVGIGVVGV